jgi:hypothetical protein
MLQSRRIRQPGRDRVTLYPANCETPTDQLFEHPGSWIEANAQAAVDLGDAR